MRSVRTAVFGPSCLLREGVESTLRRSGFKLLLEVSDYRIVTTELWLLVDTCSLYVVLSQDAGAYTRDVIATLRRRVPDSTILVLCEDVPRKMSEYLEAGVAMCLASTIEPDKLIEVLRALTDGVSMGGTEFVAPAEAAISRREWEVLKALSKGESNKHIARRLGISDATVKAHIRLILKKTGCGNRTQAVLWALAHRDIVTPGYDRRGDRLLDA